MTDALTSLRKRCTMPLATTEGLSLKGNVLVNRAPGVWFDCWWVCGVCWLGVARQRSTGRLIMNQLPPLKSIDHLRSRVSMLWAIAEDIADDLADRGLADDSARFRGVEISAAMLYEELRSPTPGDDTHLEPYLREFAGRLLELEKRLKELHNEQC